MQAPSRNGRTVSGQFAKGNAGGPGNPHGKRVADLRAALLEAVTPEDIRAVAHTLVKRAKMGEVQAIRELFDRLLGKPQQGGDGDESGTVRRGPTARTRQEQGLLASR